MDNRTLLRLLLMTGLVNLAGPGHRKRVPGDQVLTTGLTFPSISGEPDINRFVCQSTELRSDHLGRVQ